MAISRYQQILVRAGLPNQQTDQVALLRQNTVYLARLAGLNDVGYNPDGTTLPTAALPDSNTSNTVTYNTATNFGQAYHGLVSKMAQMIPLSVSQQRQAASATQGLAQRDGDLIPGHCDARISRVLEDAGLGHYWTQVAFARERANSLNNSPYWTNVTPADTALSECPNESVVTWGGNVGEGSGHTAILYKQNGRLYLLGNTEGDQALDVTNSVEFSHVLGAYLPNTGASTPTTSYASNTSSP